MIIRMLIASAVFAFVHGALIVAGMAAVFALTGGHWL